MALLVLLLCVGVERCLRAVASTLVAVEALGFLLWRLANRWGRIVVLLLKRILACLTGGAIGAPWSAIRSSARRVLLRRSRSSAPKVASSTSNANLAIVLVMGDWLLIAQIHAG